MCRDCDTIATFQAVRAGRGGQRRRGVGQRFPAHHDISAWLIQAALLIFLVYAALKY